MMRKSFTARANDDDVVARRCARNGETRAYKCVDYDDQIKGEKTVVELIRNIIVRSNTFIRRHLH